MGILLIVGEGEGEDVNPQGARRGGVSTSGSDSNFVDLEVDNWFMCVDLRFFLGILLIYELCCVLFEL